MTDKSEIRIVTPPPFTFPIYTSTKSLVFIMIRRRITNGQKLALIEQARQRMKNGDSIRSISSDFGIHPQQLRNWFKRENLIRASKRPQKGTFRRRGDCLKERGDTHVWLNL